MERWHNKIYEFSMRKCTHITIEVREQYFGFYRFDGSNPMDAFIAWMQHILKHHWIHALNIVLIGIHMQWWVLHREHL